MRKKRRDIRLHDLLMLLCIMVKWRYRSRWREWLNESDRLPDKDLLKVFSPEYELGWAGWPPEDFDASMKDAGRWRPLIFSYFSSACSLNNFILDSMMQMTACCSRDERSHFRRSKPKISLFPTEENSKLWGENYQSDKQSTAIYTTTTLLYPRVRLKWEISQQTNDKTIDEPYSRNRR